MSSGFQYNRKPAAPTIKYWVLREELQRRHIAVAHFAKALGVTTGVLTGTGSAFPMEKVERLVELLNNWDGPRRPKVRNVRLMKVSPVTTEMLATQSEGT